MPNTPRKSKEWLFFPYLAGLKNSYPEILRRYYILSYTMENFSNPVIPVSVHAKVVRDREPQVG
jgi:hypothetical protein